MHIEHRILISVVNEDERFKVIFLLLTVHVYAKIQQKNALFNENFPIFWFQVVENVGEVASATRTTPLSQTMVYSKTDLENMMVVLHSEDLDAAEEVAI